MTKVWSAVVCLVIACGDNRHPGGAVDATSGDASPVDDARGDDAPGDSSSANDAGSDAGADVTPPQIVSVTPAADVWIHDRFAVRFSEPIAPATITTTSLRLRDPANQVITGTVSLDASGEVAFVRATDTAAGIGNLRLDVAASITDLAGNPVAAQTFTFALAPWAKPAGALAVGGAPQLPAPAIAGDDIFVATSVTVGGVRRIVVTDVAGVQLGDPLGTGVAIAPALAGDATGAPIVAWADTSSGTIESAKFDGTAWIALPSLGAGSRPALAASPNGVVGIAWVDAANDLRAARLVNNAWVAQATTIAATIVADPSLAMPNDTTLIAGFIDRAAGIDRVRVATLTTTVVEKPQLRLFALPPAGTENRVSVAARGTTLIVGWDEFSGHTLSAHVARGVAGGWTVLPTLDVDVPGDARGTSVALDATNTPVASWIERVEGAHRGFVARFDGTAWITVGGDAWSGPPTRQPLRAPLVLWHDRVPVVAYRDAGQNRIELARFNGPATPKLGLPTRASIAGCSFDPVAPPSTLSATGCFTIANGVATPHPGLVPYDLRSELWSDGALKRRWIGLPDNGALTALANGSLDGPVGTLVIKEFAIDDPADRTIMETRFLVRTAAGWIGFSYQWQFDGAEANLLAAAASPTVSWPTASGGTHDHDYPSRAQCLRCHNSSVGQTLGLRRDQLARRFDYNGILDDQPRVLAQLGVLPNATVPLPVPPPHDPRVTLELRVRGYLAANCAHCHNPAGERPQQDFRLATPLANTGLCQLLTPGDPANSRVFQRVSSRPGMPPIATQLTDPLIVDVMDDWITSLASCP